LKPVAEAGFRDLEIWQYHISRLHGRELGALRERLDELRIRSVVLGGYPQLHLTGGAGEAMEAELDSLVEYGAVLGVELFKIFPGSIGSREA
jgi:sugar phosphate isomerase/epimerase